MRMSREDKDRSRARILASAGRLLRERGLDGASLADVMSEAGLTHGGFYKHFGSKDALVEAALDAAFAEFVDALTEGDTAALAAYRRRYLSEGHVTHPGIGCPAAALGPEIARGPAAVKGVFGRGVRRVVDALAAVRTGTASARRRAALREFSMMVGAVVIARASDPDLAGQVLAACRGSERDTP